MSTLSDTYGLAFVKQGLQKDQSVAMPAFAGAMLGTAVGLGGATVLLHSQIRKEIDKIQPWVRRGKKVVEQGEKMIPRAEGLLDDIIRVKKAPGIWGKAMALWKLR